MNEISQASWRDRFWAWLIDVLLISILWSRILVVLNMVALDPGSLGLLAILLFIYWTALEGYRGQSLGKMILNIAVVGPVGEKISFRDSAVESFGKAFLLPLDCLIGWIAFRGSRQRVFNKLSNTIVTNSNDVNCCLRGPKYMESKV